MVSSLHNTRNCVAGLISLDMILFASGLVILFAVVAVSCLSDNNASAQQIAKTSSLHFTNNTHTLSVTGTAITKVKPDKVLLTLGVQTINRTSNAALGANSAMMSKVINALKAAGVKKNETSTSSFSITPSYNYSQLAGVKGKITGFTVSNSIQIESSNMKNVSTWIDTALATGANTVNSVDFALSDKKLEETKNMLIKQAINNARTKADIAVSALGLKVVAVLSVNLDEPISVINPPQFVSTRQSAGEDITSSTNAPTPVISGQQHVSKTVSMIFLIG
jgi:uncharacterized protein